MRIDVNLSTHPFINRTPQLSVVGSLLAIALLATVWNIELVRRSHAATEAAAAQRAEVAREEAALAERRKDAEARLVKADLKPLTQATSAANAVLAEKAVSWTLLLERLEQTLPWSAALEQIQTRVDADGRVRLTLKFRARTHDDALEFIDALEASPCFSDVYPSQDSEPKAPSADFTMTLQATHDPFCGATPPGLPPKHRAATTRKVSRG